MDAEERYLAYVLLQQIERQHVKLNIDIHNDYTTGDDRYLKTRKNNLHLLTHYTKPTITRNSESPGKSFAQRTSDGRNPQTYGKAYWKDKEFYNCHKEVHPYYNCTNNKKKNDNNNDK